MHKHTEPPENSNSTEGEASGLPTMAQKIGGESAPKETEQSLRELIEKNLKWSQILYEQNRRINRKLFWMSLSSWFRLAVIAVPIILALWFLPPFINRLSDSYGGFLQDAERGRVTSSSLQQILQFLPLGATEKEQLRNFLK